jgi:tetratricopeptide (TPR) repeat protein
MQRAQFILVATALAAVAALYFLVPTTKPKARPGAAKSKDDASHRHNTSAFSIAEVEIHATEALSPNRQQYISALKAQMKRGEVKEQAIHLNHQLGGFWKDSVPNPLLYFYYQSQAALLENTEKSLTFAAQSILGYIPYAQNSPTQVWLANTGKGLFENALRLNAGNDSSVVGYGACIMMGADPGAEGPMAGILKVRSVVEKDSNNMFAQYMLALGGLQSQQYDKALVRLEKVAKAEPNNLEVLFKLAETNELMGNKLKAAEWYTVVLNKVKVPAMKAELEQRIAALRKP